MNPGLPILTSRTLQDQDGPIVVQLRLAALVSGSVGLVGLLLAGIGIYGVTAYMVTRRIREIGVRIALGAQRRDVVWMILSRGMTLVGLGSIVGLALAVVAGRLLRTFQFGVPAFDSVTFGSALVLFAALGVAASYSPVRRATRIDPIEALRYE